ncbi:putative choline-sulfatase [Oceanicola granulosus HTCC2516]|uniref:Putative choline-sulfatase n=1 Tax=Oceanicola granulosus (strain ATCC BAA-861 / DSM 15982 / KCTC 12143 / HTCC2516) TaxID=314256 RepID=Q2CEI6_OCEGH|nr:sulfatase-like hydrolase/transferase [Oceanicola granulosus]EAR51146.1 putative choline-sulfatase [Oceanicola granulosus HTCC2516]
MTDQTAPADPPHIFLVITDQQRFDTIRETGASWMHTPHLDRLAREGVVFERCFVNAPSCVPSRAALFSGIEPHVSGVLRNGQDWSCTWVGNLAEAGYHCVSVGKMHTIPYDAPAGFHERFVVENKDRFYEGRWFADELDKAIAAHGLTKPSRAGYRVLPDYRDRLGAVDWPLPAHLHPDSFTARTARWWLETRPRPERLFMQIGLPGPHPPYDPTEAHTRRYLDAPDLPLPEVDDAELAALPAYLQEKRRHDVDVDHDSVAWKLEPSADELRRLRAHYAANVTLIDEEIGQLMETLETTGYLDNAVVIFCSDHGDALGDHGLSQKWSMYEPVTRVPLMVWSPGRFEARRVPGLCQLFDVGPTILDLAGAARPEPCHAESLLPALEGDDWTGREIVVSEQAGDVSMTGARLVTMIRDARWKAVFVHGAGDGQLFDLETDPDERHNRFADPAAAGELRRLRDRLATWRTDTMLAGMDAFAQSR